MGTCSGCGSSVLRAGEPCPACGTVGTGRSPASVLLGLSVATLLLGACQAEYGATVTADLDGTDTATPATDTGDTGGQ